MPKNWLTADTHFGHSLIIAYCKRNFLRSGFTVDDLNHALSPEYQNGKKWEDVSREIKGMVDVNRHDQELIDNWNSIVEPEDTVYHLGDFSFRNQGTYASALNGKIILICGNHDKGVRHYKSYFHNIYNDAPLNRGIAIDGERVVLGHYPMLSWNASFHGRYHFFGHVHSTPENPYYCKRNSYDVGVDNNNYRPIEFSEAIERAKSHQYTLNFDRDVDSASSEDDPLDLIELD